MKGAAKTPEHRPAPHLKYAVYNYENDIELFYHKHTDLAEIMFMKYGSGTVTVDGREYAVAEGDVVVLNQNAIHSEQYQPSPGSGKLERVMLGLEPPAPGDGDFLLIPTDHRPILQVQVPTQRLHMLFDAIVDEVKQHGTRGNNALEGLLLALLTWISRSSQPEERSSSEADQTAALASQIQSYLKIHFCEDISLPDLAQRFYINQYYLAHLMKRHLGVPPMKYVTQLRVVEAQNLLHSTGYKTKQIAQMVGYQNPQYFLSVFKRTTGMTPKEFRHASKTAYY